MPFQIIREDITKVKADAIVNPTDALYRHLKGTDKLIHDAAGVELAEALSTRKSLNTADVTVTSSFKMTNCKYIIHAIGPVYKDGLHNEDKELIKCYKNILNSALDLKIETIAIPLISTGTFNYPKKEALKIATSVITDFIYEHELDVYLLVYDKEAFDISSKLYCNIKNYLADNGIFDNEKEEKEYYSFKCSYNNLLAEESCDESVCFLIDEEFSFDDFKEDESFNECLRRLIKEKNLFEKDVYKHANLTKQAFNGILNEGKIPKKNNVLALCIGLRLTIDEADDFTSKAGYSFTYGNKHDYIVRYFIEHKDYDIHKINDFLIHEDLPYLGSKYE